MGLTIRTISKWGTLLGKPTSKGLKVFCKENAGGKVLTTLNADNKVLRTTINTGHGNLNITKYNPYTGNVREKTQIRKNTNEIFIRKASYADNNQNIPYNFMTKSITRDSGGFVRIKIDQAGDFSGGKFMAAPVNAETKIKNMA